MTDDRSPGDRRQPYSDIGGPEARHAQTHDVRREELTNPKGPEPVDESFAEDLEGNSPEAVREAHQNATAGDTKQVGQSLPELSSDQLSQLSILETGTPLEQGATYLNLKDRARGPFKAIGGQEVQKGDQIVAKKMTDYELWNAIAGDDSDAKVERPS